MPAEGKVALAPKPVHPLEGFDWRRQKELRRFCVTSKRPLGAHLPIPGHEGVVLGVIKGLELQLVLAFQVILEGFINSYGPCELPCTKRNCVKYRYLVGWDSYGALPSPFTHSPMRKGLIDCTV